MADIIEEDQSKSKDPAGSTLGKKKDKKQKGDKGGNPAGDGKGEETNHQDNAHNKIQRMQNKQTQVKHRNIKRIWVKPVKQTQTNQRKVNQN